MRKIRDLTGQKFGRLVVMGMSNKRGDNNRVYWDCLCECGNIIKSLSFNLKNGGVRSCGCLRREKVGKINLVHGFGRRKSKFISEYHIYKSMIFRCLNSNNSAFFNYGGRGIQVCQRWLNSFEDFLEDMGPRPGPEYSIDRIDNNGDYCPENCRWATKIEQANNTRVNVRKVFNNEEMTITQWGRKLNIRVKVLESRFKMGWSIERAFTTPVRKMRKNK